MFVLDERLRNDELSDKSNLLFQLTGMNPDKPETLAALVACSSRTPKEKEFNNKFANQATKLILTNALKKDN